MVITGGMAKSKVFSDEQARLTAEIWNPGSKKWQEMAAMTDARTYHSVAILMQDGRVWVGGGGLCGDSKVNHPNAQIFTPPYLYNSSNNLANRPVINSALDNKGVPAIAKTIKIGGQTNNNNDQLIANGNYIVQGSNGQQLGSPTFDNNNVRMVNTNNNEDTNTWTFNHISDNIYTIKNVGTNNYLEVPFGKCDNGSNVSTWKEASSNWQKWIVSKNDNDFMLQPVHCTSKALDKNNGSGNNVHLWSFSSGNANQKWQIKSNSDTTIPPITEPPTTNGQLVANGTYLLKANNGQHLGSPVSKMITLKW